MSKREEIKGLIKLKYGNMEEDNKYWIEKDRSSVSFIKKGKDI